MAELSPGSYSIVIVLALIVLSVVRRTYRTFRGTRFSAGRTVFFACLYIILGCFFSGLTFYEGASNLLVIPYAALLAGAAVSSYRYADKRIIFWKMADGEIYFRGGVVIYLIYVAGLIARLSIDFIVNGSDFVTIAPSLALSGTALYASVATDLLLLLGVGLLLGRNLRVLERYRRIERGEEAIPDESPRQF